MDHISEKEMIFLKFHLEDNITYSEYIVKIIIKNSYQNQSYTHDKLEGVFIFSRFI